MKKRKKYSNPARTGPGGLYAPAHGLEVAGDFYMGGERVPEAALSPLTSRDRERASSLLTGDREQALEDYVLKPSPPKKTLPRAIGPRDRVWDDPELPDYEPQQGVGRNQPPVTPQEGRDRVGWAGQYLSDEEALTYTPVQAQKFIDLFNEASPSAEFAVGARLGQAKRGWYRMAAFSIQHLFGEDAPRFAALLAANSPKKTVEENLNASLHIWNEYIRLRDSLGREPTTREVRDWAEGSLKTRLGKEARYMIGEIPNMVRALTKADPGKPGHLSGPKVDSFAGNLLRGVWQVTNDTWMAAFAGVKQKDLKGVDRADDFGQRRELAGGAYAALSTKARMAARQLNQNLAPGERPWRALEVQECVWSLIRALGHSMGSPRLQSRDERGRAAAKVPDALQALRDLTHEQVRGNADFTTLLLSSPELLKILTRNLGLGPAVERIRSAHQGEQEINPPLTGRVLAGLTDPSQSPGADRVARRAGTVAGRFMIPTAQYQKKYARPRWTPAMMDSVLRLIYPRQDDVTMRSAWSHKVGARGLMESNLSQHYPETWIALADELRRHGFDLEADNTLYWLENQLRDAEPYTGGPYASSGYRAEGVPAEWQIAPNIRSHRLQSLREFGSLHAEPEVRALHEAAWEDDDPLAFDALADWNEDKGYSGQADLVRSLRPSLPVGHKPKQKYAKPHRVWPAARLQHTWFEPLEKAFLQDLLYHPDESIKGMAAAALGGELDALVMLLDAIEDFGLEASPEVKNLLLDTASYAAGHEEPSVAGYQPFSNSVGRARAKVTSYNPTHRASNPGAIAANRDRLAGYIQSDHSQQEQDRAAEYGQQTRDRPLPFQKYKYAADPATGRPTVAASSNTESDLSFDQALQRSRSGDHKSFRQMTDEMVEQLGLRGRSDAAVGDWEDGAEHSILNQLQDPVDSETLRYLGAWYGLMGNQRAVLLFHPDHQGLDSMYEIQVPDTDLTKVRKQLSASGVPYRTLVPSGKGTKVVIYDQHRKWRDNVSQFAQAYNAVVRESTGAGEYLGGSSRAAARRAYRKAISNYEAARLSGRKVRPQQAQSPGGGGSRQALVAGV